VIQKMIKIRLPGTDFWVVFYIVFLLLYLWSYIYNAVELINCDFKSDYKCEVVHSVGVVVPSTSIITVWFPSDD
jgi:hypothetical protein